MTDHKIIRIDGGSADYWRARKHAWKLIRDVELAEKRAADAPMYLHGGYDADGDVIPVENLGPYDRLDAAIQALKANPTAVSILVAQGRTRIGGYAVASFTGNFADD